MNVKAEKDFREIDINAYINFCMYFVTLWASYSEI